MKNQWRLVYRTLKKPVQCVQPVVLFPQIFHSNFKPLEWTVPGHGDNDCYAKLVCNKSDSMRVVGFHVIGPNAGEVTQGFALGMRLGATKRDFDMTIGIHPTNAEVSI